MRTLLFVLMSISVLSGCEHECTGNEILTEFENSVTIRSIHVDADNGVNKEYDTYTRKSFNNRITVESKYLELHSDIDLYHINNSLGDLKNISLPYNGDTNLESGYQVNVLYSTINIGDFSWYHGAIPFKGGRFSEIKDPTVNGGNGLAIINNQVYLSDFVSYNTTIENGEFSLIIGKSKFDTKLHYNGLLTKNNQSSGTYVLSTYENGNHFFEVDYYTMKSTFDDIQPWDIKIGGIGYIYNDSLDSGLTFYTNIGISETDDKVTDVIYSHNIPTFAYQFLEAQGATVKDYYNQKGYAVLVGTNYEFDTKDYGFNIGAEIFKTWGSWVSANHGVIFLSDHSWYANRNAIEYTLYAGTDITQNLRISTKFVYTDAKQVPSTFSITQSKDQNSAFHKNDFYTHFDKLEFLINYKF